MTPIRKIVSLALAALALAGGTAIARAQEASPDMLARNVKALARNPSDVGLLIATGRAALQVGDANAAAGFFGRARELAPNSAAAHSGMASTLVALNQPAAAIVEFANAKRLGTPPGAMAADLGLAYDLAGDQQKAQAVYRSALGSTDGAESRRRLALSLAIGGDGPGALQLLQPLLASADKAAMRTRAFVLALGGDVDGSKAALDAITRGGGSAAEPFLRMLPSLAPGEKAAALNLGIFPARFAGGTLDRGVDEGATGIDLTAADDPAIAAHPMEYGGTAKPPSPANLDAQRRAKLALYGVFPEP